MNTLVILMSIFVASFVIGYVWSYLLVYKNGMDGKMHHNKKLSISKFIQRTRFALGNFFLMSVVTCVSLFLIGEDLFTFESIGVLELVIGFVVMLVVDDVWFYGIHRIMHENKFLYRRIHSVHHRAIPPIPMDYLYAHPIEAMGASMGLIWGLLVLVLTTGTASIWVFAAYTVYRTLHELAIHSGLEIIPEKWLGPLGGSKHHFNHHRYNAGNYASGLVILDKVFATEIKR